MNNKAIEIVEDLGFTHNGDWQIKALLGPDMVQSTLIQISGKEYCVTCTTETHIYTLSREDNGLVIIYSGFSLEKLKEAIMREEKTVNA